MPTDGGIRLITERLISRIRGELDPGRQEQFVLAAADKLTAFLSTMVFYIYGVRLMDNKTIQISLRTERGSTPLALLHLDEDTKLFELEFEETVDERDRVIINRAVLALNAG